MAEEQIDAEELPEEGGEGAGNEGAGAANDGPPPPPPCPPPKRGDELVVPAGRLRVVPHRGASQRDELRGFRVKRVLHPAVLRVVRFQFFLHSDYCFVAFV